MLFKGIPFIVTLEEARDRSPKVKLGLKVKRPYRLTDANGSLAIDLYLILTAHALKDANTSGWNSLVEAKNVIAKTVYKDNPKAICWNASWYDVSLVAKK